MAKPPSWGSMPVMRCSLSVQAAGPRRRRSVSRRDRSGGTRPLRRIHERSHRASPVVSSWSQLSRIGIAAGFAGAARASGCAASAEPVPSGAHTGGPGDRGSQGGQGGQPRGDGHGPWWGRTAGPRGRSGCLLTSICVVGCLGRGAPGVRGVPRGPPCSPLQDVDGRLLVVRQGPQRAPRATPGVPALPRWCSTCPHTGGISSAPWPLAPGGAAPTSEWRPPPLVRRAGWPAAPCVVPACGPGPPHRGLASRARARGLGRHRAARLLAATFASAWSRFGGRVCPSIAGRGRPVASGTPRTGPPAGAPGRRGAPLPVTLPASPPGRCPTA